MKFFLKKNEGFTLVELLVYTSILAIVSGLMVGVLSTLVRVQNQETSLLEVSEQSQFLLQSIQRNIRDSSAIIIKTATTTTPLEQDSNPAEGSVLRLKMRGSGATSTVTIYLEGTTVKVAERDDDTLVETVSSLTSDRVSVSSLSFKKRTNPPGHDVILVDFTIAFNTDNPQLSVSRTLQSAVSRVSAAVFDSAILPSDDTGTYAIGSASARWGSGYFRNNLIVNGKIGVATTTTPTYEVDVVGGIRATAASVFSTSTFSGFLGIGSGVSTATSTLYIRRDANDALTSLFVVNGSTGSSARPQVAVGEDEQFKGFAMSYRGANAANTDLASASSTGVLHAFSSAYNGINIISSASTGSSSIRFATGGQANSNERMIINSSGNVGIGTSTPGSSLLAVNGQLRWGGAPAYTYSGIDSGGLFIEHVGTSTTNDDMRLQTSLSGAQGSYVTLTLNPSSGFAFTGAGGATTTLTMSNGSLSLRNGSNSNGTGVEFHIRPSSGQDGLITFTEDAVADRWRVGTLNGSGNFYWLNSSGNSMAFFESDGDLEIGDNTTIGCLRDGDSTILAGSCNSDARLKEDITPLGNVLNKIAQLVPVRFRWKEGVDESADKNGDHLLQTGLIAQEVEKVLPEWVVDGSDGYKKIDFSQIQFYLLQAVKELKAENDTLKAKNQELEGRIKKVEEKLGL